MSAKAQSEWEAHAALGAANGGDFLQACEIAIRAFETYPGAQWDRDQLRDLSTEITDRWIRNLSRDEKTYLRTLVANAESPVGIWMRCLLDWKLGQREQGIEVMKGLIQTVPNSVGGEHAIMGYLLRDPENTENDAENGTGPIIFCHGI